MYRKAADRLDPLRRAALSARVNGLVRGDGGRVPPLLRLDIGALSNRLVAPLTRWDLAMSTLADWYREA